MANVITYVLNESLIISDNPEKCDILGTKLHLLSDQRDCQHSVHRDKTCVSHCALFSHSQIVYY